MEKEILKFCMEKGFLVDSDFLELFSGTSDITSVKFIIEKVKDYTNQNFLTKNLFEKNKDKINEFFLNLPEKNQKNLEKLKVKLGLSIKISKEVSKKVEAPIYEKNVNILSYTPKIYKKLEVKNFVRYFNKRFEIMRNLLQEHSELDNLVSIGKISGNKQGISIIGMVYSKKITKNKNIMLEVEDTSGKIKVLINQSKKELYQLAEKITLDSVLGFRCSGNNEILFVNQIIFPEAKLPEKKKSPFNESALFIGDLHFGSKKFLRKSFLKFIDYLNGKLPNTPEVKNIKYLFLVGDVVTGVGNYPNQEKDLEIPELEEQFSALASILDKIPKYIKIIISPGNHDGVRIMEPQPTLDIKYAWPLEQLENVIFTENPSFMNIGAQEDFLGFNVLTYHGFSYPYYANNIPYLLLKKSMNHPEEIMKYLLKNRHLAPTHGSTQYYPFEKDPLIIKDVPDIFVSAHTHKSAVSSYENILIVSTSCWEAMTSYQEKFGNKPDHCKVPLVNLKTRAVKILDFEIPEEVGGGKGGN